MKNDIKQTKNFWNQVSGDWDKQVGDVGDDNRVYNSDPVLWEFCGSVKGKTVLDAGCGTGYLSRKLHNKGATVIGIDFAPDMVRIAREKSPDIRFLETSCSELTGIDDNSIDIIVSNYVLMDTPDLSGTLSAFYRVLIPQGLVVAVFSHPCFPQGGTVCRQSDEGVQYTWQNSYFESRKYVDPPWGHFSS